MIIIYNTIVQILKTIAIKGLSEHNTVIDATNQVSGIYYLSVANISFTKPIKFIKIR